MHGCRAQTVSVLHAQLIQPDSLLMASDVARVFDVTSEAVRKWERAGRLSALRTLRGTRLFRGSDVLRLQQERAVPTVAR